MLFNVWLLPALMPSPYTAPTWLGQWFAAQPQIAITMASNQTGQSAASLQASPVMQSAFIWNPGYHQ